MKKFILTIILGFFLAAPVFSQSGEETGVRKIVSLKNRLVNFLEERELRGVDTNYVGSPRKKWAVFANSYLSSMDFNLRSRIVDNADDGNPYQLSRAVIDLHSKTQKQVSLGLYFMGYGLSYSVNLGKGYERDLTLTLYSSPVGGEFRYHSTNRIKGTMDIKDLYGEELKVNINGEDAKMDNFILNVYYVFNPKKFSYASAMSYSKVQKKSAGSVIAGLTVNRTRLKSSDPWLSYVMGTVNRIKIQQFAIGAGYGYNWVPAKNLNIHISEIPMLLITTKSATKMKSEKDDSWSNMQKEGQKKLFGSRTHVSFSHMLRFSSSYTWNDRYQAGISTYYNYFRVGKHSSYYASTSDWNLRFFFAYRF